LGLFYTSQLLFWILSVSLILLNYNWQWVVALVALRFIIQLLSFGFTAKKLGEADLIVLTPIIELFLITTQLSIFIANLISKQKHWK